MSLSIKRIILFVSALSVSLFCAFFADQVIHRIDAGNEKNKNRTAVFTDGSEAFGISGCEIENKKVIITGPDPQFVLPGPDQEISRIDLLFSEQPIPRFRFFMLRRGRRSVRRILFMQESHQAL